MRQVLKEIRVLSKSTTIKKEFFHLLAGSHRSFVEFSLEFHRDAPELCMCKTGFRPKCQAWAKVELIEVELVFHGEHKEHTTFALLKGDGTALRLKMKVHAHGSSEFLSVFNIIGKDDEKIICKARTQIRPLDMREVSIYTIGDDTVAEDEGNGDQTFQDVLGKGGITAEVWSIAKYEVSHENASNSNDVDDNEDASDHSSRPPYKKSKKRKATPRSIKSDKYEDIGEELVQENPVNEKYRKIGYLEFEKPRKNHAPSAAALAWQEEQDGIWLKNMEAKIKRENIKDDYDLFKLYRNVRQELLAKVSVVARRVEQLVRNAMERGNYIFFEELCEKGVSLPDSTILEELGVPLYLIEKAGLEMASDQQQRRVKQEETVSIYSEEDGESMENSSGAVRDNSNNTNISCVDHYSESPTRESTATTGQIIETADKEKCKTDMQITSSSSKGKTLLQRISDAETQLFCGNRRQPTSILDFTQSASIRSNLHARVKIINEAMGSPEEKKPVSEKLISKLSKVEECIDTLKLRISILEEEVFEQVSIIQRIESLPRRLDRIEKELGQSEDRCDIITRVYKLESVLL